MILIIGLGNPGKKYEKTRHNIGFMVLDAFAKEVKADDFKIDSRRNAKIANGMLTFPSQKKHVRFVLAKPQTYMNESGRAVKALADFYKVRTEDQLWVVHDDLDIELGTVRVRLSGSSAGQKGVQSIIDYLGTDQFTRFRVGIKPKEGQKIPAEEFVLKPFSKDEKSIVDSEIKQVVELLTESCDQGVVNQSI